MVMLSSLLVASCSSTENHRPPANLTQKNCAECVYFNVKAWVFTPLKTDGKESLLLNLERISRDYKLKSTDHLLTPDLSSAINIQTVISPSNYSAVPTLFREHGSFDLIADADAVTARGAPLPFVVETVVGKFSSLLTSTAVSGNSLSNMVSFEINSDLPIGGSVSPVINISSKGRVLLSNGEALLNIQKTIEGYIVWLISASSTD